MFLLFLSLEAFPYTGCVSLLILFFGWNPGGTAAKASNSVGVTKGASPGLAGIVVEKSVEFSYEELATATNDFSLANKIGEGGFGSVYYAELRGEVCLISFCMRHYEEGWNCAHIFLLFLG